VSGETPLLIRDARPEDRAAIRALTLAAYEEHAPVMAPSAWAALRDAITTTLDGEVVAERIVAERHGAIVGSVMLCPPSEGAYGGELARLASPEVRLRAVSQAARRQGVGKALMDECMRRARASGATSLGLHTSDSLRAAVRMYERMGFERNPDDDFQPPGAELVKAYRLRLSDEQP
jgi:ribosomal protein S18 acetylase RimI-like enzyme